MILIAVSSIFVIVLTVLYFGIKTYLPKRFNLKGAHVMITGGSSGIGKAVAAEVLKHDAYVTLIARDEGNLLVAAEELSRSSHDRRKVNILPLDITSDPEVIYNRITEHMSNVGEVGVLINCAGYSRLYPFSDTPLSEFKRQIEVNYLGSVYVTRAVVPIMKALNRGRIVFVSSSLGQMGVYGASAYSASKFALRGFAESLQMEVSPNDIRVTVVFPADTDTPGLHEENKTKPKETALISQVAGLASPHTVAMAMVNDMIDGRFLSCLGFEGTMLTILTSGMAPVSGFLELFLQVATLGIIRFVSVFYLFKFAAIVKKCSRDKHTIRQ